VSDEQRLHKTDERWIVGLCITSVSMRSEVCRCGLESSPEPIEFEIPDLTVYADLAYSALWRTRAEAIMG
jgi:hypothetical protein